MRKILFHQRQILHTPIIDKKQKQKQKKLILCSKITFPPNYKNMSSSEIEELKKQLALFQAAAPDIADKVREYEEQQRIEREEREERERYEKIINNIPKAIEYISMDTSYEPERQELIKEVLELAFEKIKNQEERIQDLEETIYEIDNPDEFKFEPFCIEKHKYSIIQSKLEPGEYIIKEIYSIHSGEVGSIPDNMYITNFGNLLSFNINILTNMIRKIVQSFTSSCHIHNANYNSICKYFNIQPSYEIEKDQEILYSKLFGCELSSRTNPFYKAVCNKNTILEPFLVEAIKKYKFDIKIHYCIKIELNSKTNQYKIIENQSSNGKNLNQFFEENTFGGFLKDKIINFIEEVRRSHPRINYDSIPIANLPSEIPIAEPVLGIPESASTEVLKNAAEQRRENIRNRVIRRKRYESKSGGSSGNLLRWNIG